LHPPIVDQVIDFYQELFRLVFSDPFRPQIVDRIKRNAVIRQVEQSADAASQSLSRFFLNERLSEGQVADIFTCFSALCHLMRLDDIANVAPESLVEELLVKMPCSAAVKTANQEAVYRVAMHSVVQVLMLAGPVMAEWQKLNFSATFELLRRVSDRLNQISAQLECAGARRGGCCG